MNKLTKLEKYWILYDVGNSAFILLVATIVPIYFNYLASLAKISEVDYLAYWGYASSFTTLIVAIIGPVLGSIVDTKGYKKPIFTISMIIGVMGLACFSVPKSWIIFLGVFVIAKIGYNASLIFYDSMLVDVTTDERMDEVSSHGYAWGYIGSCIPFVGSLILVLMSDRIGISAAMAMMLAFGITAIWWVAVTIPLLLNYKQNYYAETKVSVKETVVRLGSIFSELKANKKVLLFLISFFFYIDGVYTIIEMSTAYGKDVGIGDSSMLLALLLTQVVAFPCSILFGKLARRFESEKLILVCIGAYFLIALFALQLDTAWKFWFLATCVGVFQGAIQALSRSYYAKIIPKEKASEYFGVFDIFGKGASFLGTMLMGISTQLFHTSKAGVVMIAALFVLGFVTFCLQGRQAQKGAQTQSVNPAQQNL